MLLFLILVLSVCQPALQKDGVVVSLPSKEKNYISMTKVKAAVDKVGPEIHTWSHKRSGYQLECRVSVTSPGHYSVKLLYNSALLEAVEVTRFDGELTKSITVQSTNDTVHVVQYLLTDRSCVTRYYTASTSDNGQFDKKQDDCEFPATLWNLHTTKFRNNGWIWGKARWENWDKTTPGLWKGAIAAIPDPSAAPDNKVLSALKLHSWSNIVPGYHMTLYRLSKNGETYHYIAIYYKMQLLQSDVQITKFDDTLLNSVSVGEPTGPQNDQYQVQYKFHDGSCKDRFYSWDQEKVTSTTSHLEISENDCQKFTAYKLWTSVSNIDAINGWLY